MQCHDLRYFLTLSGPAFLLVLLGPIKDNNQILFVFGALKGEFGNYFSHSVSATRSCEKSRRLAE